MPVDANGEELTEIHVCIFRSINDGARTPVFILIRAAFPDRQFEESGGAVVTHAKSRLLPECTSQLAETAPVSCIPSITFDP